MARGAGLDASPRFDPELFDFLAELRKHNAKPWFDANRSRYERLYRDALLGFVGAVGERLPRVVPELVADARPTGGSLMRIFRDVRFSKDKSPYRPYAVVHFRHRAGPAEGAPGLFLYVAADEISAGGGLWHPTPGDASRVRAAIARDPGGWKRATRSAKFRARFALEGDSLQRVPSGLPVGTDLEDDLRRKSFVATTELTRAQFTSAAFLASYLGIARDVAPLVRFVARALDLDARAPPEGAVPPRRGATR